MASIVEPSRTLPVAPLLSALGMSRASFYRYRAGSPSSQPPTSSADEALATICDPPTAVQSAPSPVVPAAATRPCPVPGRGLSPAEQELVRQTLYSERFGDDTPTEIFATLLDEGTYLCSVSTMYRLLRGEGANEPRSRARRHAHYEKPELLATRPNEVWSWDITKLKGPRPWSYYYLYVIIDVFSRYVVGYTVAYQESKELATQLIDETLHKQNILPGQLTIHADRGSAMTSKPVALLMSDLGVLKTHARPHVSNDNPYSEAHFKTLKYRPDFPARFASIEHARSDCARFFEWYNGEHHHGGLALLTPVVVHHGAAEHVISHRQQQLDAAYRRHPQRFVNRPPRHAPLPEAVWINPPAPAPAVNTQGNDTDA